MVNNDYLRNLFNHTANFLEDIALHMKMPRDHIITFFNAVADGKIKA